MAKTEQRRGARMLIRNPQDFWGGVALAAFAAFALWASYDLTGTRGFAFGPGTAPRLFAGLLLIVSLVIAVMGLVTDGPPLEKWGVRGPVFFLMSVVFFGAAIRPLGLLITAFTCLLIAAAASKEARPVETVIWSAVLTGACAALFIYGLKLPLQLWPRF